MLEGRRPGDSAPGRPSSPSPASRRPTGSPRRSKRQGWQVATMIGFRDHHRVHGARHRADGQGRARTPARRRVLTTEKDAMRLLPLRPLPVPVAAVPLRRDAFEPAEQFRAVAARRVARGARVMLTAVMRQSPRIRAGDGRARFVSGSCRRAWRSTRRRDQSVSCSIAIDGSHRRLAVGAAARRVSHAHGRPSAARSRDGRSSTSASCSSRCCA